MLNLPSLLATRSSRLSISDVSCFIFSASVLSELVVVRFVVITSGRPPGSVALMTGLAVELLILTRPGRRGLVVVLLEIVLVLMRLAVLVIVVASLRPGLLPVVLLGLVVVRLVATTSGRPRLRVVLMGRVVVLMGRVVVLIGRVVVLMGLVVVWMGRVVVLMARVVVLMGLVVVLMGRVVVLMGLVVVLMGRVVVLMGRLVRSEEHTSELQSR